MRRSTTKLYFYFIFFLRDFLFQFISLCVISLTHSNILTSVKRSWRLFSHQVLLITQSEISLCYTGMSQFQYARWKIACCFICWIFFSMNRGRVHVANATSMSISIFSTNNSQSWKRYKIYLINPCAFFNIFCPIESLLKIFKWNYIISAISFVFVASFPEK